MNINKYLYHINKARKYRSILFQIFDLLFHKVFINTCFQDYYRYHFFDGARSLSKKSRYVGQFGSLYYPYDQNPHEFLYLLGNKLLFKSIATVFGFPQPRLVATINQDSDVSFTDFSGLFRKVDEDLVLKRLSGSGGKGLLIYKHATQLFSKNGKEFTIKGAYDIINKHRYLVEERIIQHDILNLFHPESLNTYRIITIKTRDGKWHCADHAYLRIGQKGSHIDNNSIGVGINNNGVTYCAFDLQSKNDVTHHPDTKENLIKVKVPHFARAVKIAIDGSKIFKGFGTIGWDFGIKIDGPIVMEANGNYDCHLSQMGSMGPLITPKIAKGIKRHYFFSRWNKNFIHPLWTKGTRKKGSTVIRP